LVPHAGRGLEVPVHGRERLPQLLRRADGRVRNSVQRLAALPQLARAALDAVHPEAEVQQRASERDEPDQARPGHRRAGVPLVEDRVERGDPGEEQRHADDQVRQELPQLGRQERHYSRSLRAAERSSDSPPSPATSWTPTGSPSRVPTGAESTGTPARLNGEVNRVMTRESAGPSRSPMTVAGTGVDGTASTVRSPRTRRSRATHSRWTSRARA